MQPEQCFEKILSIVIGGRLQLDLLLTSWISQRTEVGADLVQLLLAQSWYSSHKVAA